MASPSSPQADTLLQTPLAALNRGLGARMVAFAGWEMPVQYPSGILAEHQAVRSNAGLFDLSHMGRVYLRGRDALRLAQQCCTRDLSRIRAGEAAYSVICHTDGTIVDDVIGYLLGPEEVLFVFNAANRLIDLDVFAAERDRSGLAVSVEDRTLATALIGLQGPAAQALLEPLIDTRLDALPGYAFTTATAAGAPTLISRTGYTGEDGFELLVEADAAERAWMALQERGATPAGLGARDTLRTEAGFALYGHDIDRTTNPYEARLGWVVNLNKGEFLGHAALAQIKAEGPRRRLVGLRVMAGGVPRPGSVIKDTGGEQLGQVTSGTFSPTLKHNIAMGYVPLSASQPGYKLQVETRGRAVAAEVVALPFVAHRSRPRASIS